MGILGGTWNKPEHGVLGDRQDGGRGGGGVVEEMEAEGSGGGDGRRGSTSGGFCPVDGFPPQACPHPSAELLRIITVGIAATGGAVVFPALGRVFSHGAAV